MVRSLGRFGVQPSTALMDAIRAYTELLLRWNRKISLTSITEPQEILERHFGESMFAAGAVNIIRGQLMDVGSGAGFPGLALKLVSPELEVTLIEANMKKCAFLGEVVRALGLSGVRIVSQRIESLKGLDAAADFVSCRAVRPERKLLAWMRGALAVGGRCVLWLGAEDAAAVRERAGWEWNELMPIPGSQSRVLLVGRPT